MAGSWALLPVGVCSHWPEAAPYGVSTRSELEAKQPGFGKVSTSLGLEQEHFYHLLV